MVSVSWWASAFRLYRKRCPKKVSTASLLAVTDWEALVEIYAVLCNTPCDNDVMENGFDNDVIREASIGRASIKGLQLCS